MSAQPPPTSSTSCAPDAAVHEFVVPRRDDEPLHIVGRTLSHALLLAAKANGGRLKWLDFNGMDVGGLAFGDIELMGCSFDGVRGAVSCSETTFVMCSFVNADLTGTHMHDCCFESCGMHDAVLRNMSGRRVRFSNCFMPSSDFSDNYMLDWVLADCVMPQASLANCRLAATVVVRNDLSGADLTGMSTDDQPDFIALEANDLRDTRWRGTELFLGAGSKANRADGADFRGSFVSYTNAGWHLGGRLGLYGPSVFIYGPRTKLPLAPLPWLYAHPMAAACVVGIVVGAGALLLR